MLRGSHQKLYEEEEESFVCTELDTSAAVSRRFVRVLGYTVLGHTATVACGTIFSFFVRTCAEIVEPLGSAEQY